MQNTLHGLAIASLCIAAAILYGIAHDMVTTRICIEFFTIGHPRIIATKNPTALAVLWGVFATWWVGLGLGIALALAARAGTWPRITAMGLVDPIAILLAAIAVVATLAGFIGHALASHGLVILLGDLAERVPKDRHVAYLTDLWAHIAAYGAGGLGGVVLCARTLWLRRRLARAETKPT